MSGILVAGMGNVLRGDDGFGVAVARALAEAGGLPDDVTVIEVGIGGIHLVQELLRGYDALIVLDALEGDASAGDTTPGTVRVLGADVPDLETWPAQTRADFLADMHYTTPSKALMLARALGRLPERVWIVGCQPADADTADIGLSDAVQAAVPRGVEVVRRLLDQARGRPTAHDIAEEPTCASPSRPA